MFISECGVACNLFNVGKYSGECPDDSTNIQSYDGPSPIEKIKRTNYLELTHHRTSCFNINMYINFFTVNDACRFFTVTKQSQMLSRD